MLRFVLPALAVCLLCQPAFSQKPISQFNKAGYCDFLIDKSGIYHTVFQESPDIGKPVFIYYASSTDKGATWSRPITLSNDGTGNGSSYARILQDGSGRIYAIWKRFGKSTGQYPTASELLDGPGGYSLGTLFYKVLSGGVWSNAVQLNEDERAQQSWFASADPKGNVWVFWDQLSKESMKSDAWYQWYYCDYLRTTMLNGTSYAPITDLNKPGPPVNEGGPPEGKGGINLQGYIDATGRPHLAYEDKTDNGQQIKYYDGQQQRVAYSYPMYQEGNSFNNPAKLLVDENGVDHLVFKPSSATLESEQLWDLNLATNKTNVLVAIQKQGVKIQGFQASQGPGGTMAVTIEAGSLYDNAEAYGIYYEKGNWKNVALTNNASKEKFFYKEFPPVLGYRSYISSLTRYISRFASVAYDATGRKNLLLTIDAFSTTGGYASSSPSLVFVPVDK